MTSRVILSKQPCPVCPSSDAYHLYDDGHGWCYSCNYLYLPNRSDSLSDVFTYEYIPHRGLTKETLRFYDIKTKVDKEGKPIADGFKYPNGSYKVRLLDKKDFYTEGEIAQGGLFGKDKFGPGSHRCVTITEGEYDAASLYQVVRSPVVSIQSASTGVRDCARDYEWLNSFERVYLAFDADTHGSDCARAVARLFDYSKLYQVKFGHRKDSNEFLQHGEEQELLNIWTNAKKYLPESIVSSQEDFKKILLEPIRKGVPYPFPTLTEMTYGIRTGESVLITAQEGVGKTEIMHAIEYQLLKETDSNVAAIFLEEPKRRHLQAIAGLELKLPAHLPDAPCTADQIYSSLEKVLGKDERLYLYSHFGSDDPEHILDTIRFLVSASGCRYVLLDHISMVVSGLAGEDERRALDYLSTKLQMMVKELDFSLIVVSHVNDFGQTRGSRYISKIADIRVDAIRDVTHADPIERNKISLTVSKNRFSGRTGPAGHIRFDPKTFTFTQEASFEQLSPSISPLLDPGIPIEGEAERQEKEVVA